MVFVWSQLVKGDPNYTLVQVSVNDLIMIVAYAPIAGLLRVLCLPGQKTCVENAVLRHTHTLGLRVQTLDRIVAPRRAAAVDVAGQRLAAKEYTIEGETYTRPEADALKAAAWPCGLGVPALRNARGKN